MRTVNPLSAVRNGVSRPRTQRVSRRLAAIVLGMLFCASLTAVAQEPPSAPAEATALLGPEQLDQLLAPIALYPDPLLANILMAATYPLEVVQAARWVQDPSNAALKGDRLTEALALEDWAPSVKALVPFPDVLRMMDSRLDWMQQLGNAFLSQEAAVMESVQRLRRAAEEAGTLQSTPEQTVTTTGTTIIVEPASPTVVYVPYYDPFLVYGVWPYPAYPPFYFPLPPIYVSGVVHTTRIYFGVGVAVVNLLWGWHHWDWHDHRLYINVSRYNLLNTGRPRVTRDLWDHDPYHRRGVIYPTQRLRERYRHSRSVGAPGTLRDYRGYTRPAAPERRTAPAAPLRTQPSPAQRQRVVPQAAPARRAAPLQTQPRREERQRTIRQQAPKTRTRPESQSRQGAPAAPLRTQPSGTSRPAAPTQRTAPLGVQPSQSRTQQRLLRQQGAPSRPAPPAFQGIGRGAEVRTQSNRGRESRSTRSFMNTAPARQQPGAGQGNRREDRSRRRQ